MNYGIYIMSCDKTRDVLSHFVRGFNKFWPDCQIVKFLGANSTFNVGLRECHILETKPSNWKQESIEQLKLIKSFSPNITHILVFLDDFILSDTVNNNQVIKTFNELLNSDIKYLRATPLEQSFFVKNFSGGKKKYDLGHFKIFEVEKAHPYFSSLQVAFWDIDYLLFCIYECENIWDFENRVHSIKHFSVFKTLFKYKHVVEKGRWHFYAKSYCLKHIDYFDAGYRDTIPMNFENWVIYNLKKFKFIFFGYLFSKKYSIYLLMISIIKILFYSH